MDIPALNRDQLFEKWKATIEKTFDVFSWSSGHDLALLAEFASQASEIIEVGSYHGKSARVMAFAGPSARIVCIDQPEDDRCWKILEANTDGLRVLLRRGTSTEQLPITHPGRLFDLAFIDAGHKYDDVVTDIRNLLPRMAPGAILAGHDWRGNNPLDDVNRAVEACFDRHRIHVMDNVWFVKL